MAQLMTLSFPFPLVSYPFTFLFLLLLFSFTHHCLVCFLSCSLLLFPLFCPFLSFAFLPVPSPLLFFPSFTSPFPFLFRFERGRLVEWPMCIVVPFQVTLQIP